MTFLLLPEKIVGMGTTSATPSRETFALLKVFLGVVNRLAIPEEIQVALWLGFGLGMNFLVGSNFTEGRMGLWMWLTDCYCC